MYGSRAEECLSFILHGCQRQAVQLQHGRRYRDALSLTLLLMMNVEGMSSRNPPTNSQVAEAIIKAITSVESADVAPANVVVRFSESVGGFPLPKGYSEK